jgi:hypothetical protein
VHPVRSGGQPVPDVRWAGREDAPAHVPSRLVLSALLPGLRAAVAPRPARPLVSGRSQWADGGWGPRVDANGRHVDPWYRDTRPHREPEPWVPHRDWF